MIRRFYIVLDVDLSKAPPNVYEWNRDIVADILPGRLPGCAEWEVLDWTVYDTINDIELDMEEGNLARV